MGGQCCGVNLIGIWQEEELAGWCRAHLAPYKAPRHWAFVDQLPLTSAGKVRKFMLREWFARERAGS